MKDTIKLQGAVEISSESSLKQAIDTGQYTIQIIGGKAFLWITAENDKKSVSNPTGKVTSSRMKEDMAELDIPVTKRKYTKREDWINPDLPPDHEDNRPDTRFQTRIDYETHEMAEAFIKATGMTKKELAKQAIREFIEKRNFDIE